MYNTIYACKVLGYIITKHNILACIFAFVSALDINIPVNTTICDEMVPYLVRGGNHVNHESRSVYCDVQQSKLYNAIVIPQYECKKMQILQKIMSK